MMATINAGPSQQAPSARRIGHWASSFGQLEAVGAPNACRWCADPRLRDGCGGGHRSPSSFDTFAAAVRVEKRRLERRDDGRQLAHAHTGADQARDQVVQGRHRGTHQERLGVMALKQSSSRSTCSSGVPAATRRAAAGSEVRSR